MCLCENVCFVLSCYKICICYVWFRLLQTARTCQWIVDQSSLQCRVHWTKRHQRYCFYSGLLPADCFRMLFWQCCCSSSVVVELLLPKTVVECASTLKFLLAIFVFAYKCNEQFKTQGLNWPANWSMLKVLNYVSHDDDPMKVQRMYSTLNYISELYI